MSKSTSPALMRHLLQERAAGRKVEAMEQLLDIRRFNPDVLERVGKAMVKRAKGNSDGSSYAK